MPADVRLLKMRTLRVDESALTGETLPADKALTAVEVDTALGVVTGVSTGMGRIGDLLSTVAQTTTCRAAGIRVKMITADMA